MSTSAAPQPDPRSRRSASPSPGVRASSTSPTSASDPPGGHLAAGSLGRRQLSSPAPEPGHSRQTATERAPQPSVRRVGESPVAPPSVGADRGPESKLLVAVGNLALGAYLGFQFFGNIAVSKGMWAIDFGVSLLQAVPVAAAGLYAVYRGLRELHSLFRGNQSLGSGGARTLAFAETAGFVGAGLAIVLATKTWVQNLWVPKVGDEFITQHLLPAIGFIALTRLALHYARSRPITADSGPDAPQGPVRPSPAFRRSQAQANGPDASTLLTDPGDGVADAGDAVAGTQRSNVPPDPRGLTANTARAFRTRC